MSRQTEHLALAARKAATRERYVASALEQYRRQERFGEEEMRAKLHCSEEDYHRLALCQTPDLHSEKFAESIRRIADFANVSAEELARVVKQVQAIQTFSDAREKKAREAMLLAARDKSSDTDNEENETNGEKG